LIAQVLEANFQFVPNLLEGAARDPDSARFRQSFQPRRDINAIAVQIFSLGYDIAEIYTDPKLYLAVLGSLRIPILHRTLHLHGASDRIDDAGEFHEKAIAHRFEYPAIVGLDAWIERFGDVRLDGGKRAFLILAYEPAIAEYIGRKNGGEPALNGFYGHF
jgi:hypothetical protein